MKKSLRILLSATVLFLVLGVGFLLGRMTVRPVTVRTGQLVSPVAEVSRSLPSETEIERLCINTATREELAGLPGIGEILADRIVAYREANGPFRSLSELQRVSGIGEKTLTEIWDLISLE